VPSAWRYLYVSTTDPFPDTETAAYSSARFGFDQVVVPFDNATEQDSFYIGVTANEGEVFTVLASVALGACGRREAWKGRRVVCV